MNQPSGPRPTAFGRKVPKIKKEARYFTSRASAPASYSKHGPTFPLSASCGGARLREKWSKLFSSGHHDLVE